MKNIAIIPARSGSKGLKDKNIKELCGKPMLAYTIEAAITSGMFDEVMVSTDSEEYADIARKYGAKVPFLRSKENASDMASSWDMVKEVLNGYSTKNIVFDTFCLLQPTSPLRDADDIKKAYEIFYNNESIATVSVCEMEHSIKWCNTLDSDGSLNGFVERGNSVRRQALGKYYRLNGAIYIVSIKAFYEDDFIYRQGSYAYIMDGKKSIDIDNEYDFIIAEAVMQYTK